MEEQLENLTYGQALEHLKQGRAITRAVWGGYWLIEHAHFTKGNAPNIGIVIAYTKWGSVEPAQPYWQDMFASDWKVLSTAEVSLANQKIAVWAPGQHKGTYNLNFNMEVQACEGLNVKGYPGKWGKAKTYANGLFPDGNSKEHWDAVRLHFLELGGEFLGAQPDLSAGAMQPMDVGYIGEFATTGAQANLPLPEIKRSV